MTPVPRHADPRNWPVTVTVPLIVALLMVTIGTLISHQVLRRLEQSQTQNLTGLSNTYLDGLSAALLPSVLRADVWEVFDVLDRASQRYAQVNSLETVVVDLDGRVLAASDPRRFPTDDALPQEWRGHFGPGDALQLDLARARAFASRRLLDQGRLIGTIFAEIDIAALMAERDEVLWALVGTNVAITLLLATGGYFLVRRTMRPIGLLSERLSRGRQGVLVEIPESAIGTERSSFARVFRRYNDYGARGRRARAAGPAPGRRGAAGVARPPGIGPGA